MNEESELLDEVEAVLEKISRTACSHGNPFLNQCGPCIAGGYLQRLRMQRRVLRQVQESLRPLDGTLSQDSQ